MAPPDEDDYLQGTGRRYSGNDDSGYFTSRREPAYTSFKDRKARLARSKSTHGFGEDLEGDLDENSASSYYPASYLASKASNAGNDLSRSRSSHVLKSRENSPERPLSSNTGITFVRIIFKSSTTVRDSPQLIYRLFVKTTEYTRSIVVSVYPI